MPNVTLEWCKAEHRERVGKTPVNPGKAWLLRKEVWNEFLVDNYEGVENVGRVFEYTYSERMWWQIPQVINELQERPDTRQAIIQVHNREIDGPVMGIKRIPCSMYYHFMYRNGALDIIYNMRSTDFATHFQNDIWQAIALQEFIANKVGMPTGKFIMQASSLHIYKKDWDELQRY